MDATRFGGVVAGKRLRAAVLLGAIACVVPAGQEARAQRPLNPPNDPLFKYQWHLPAIQAPAAWTVSRGEGVTVAVLDTGVAFETRGRYRRAPDLGGTRFARGWDFVDGDAYPNDEPPRVRQSHGTHIAGIIAQTTDNGIGAAGVAPGATIMPIRVLKPDLSGSARTIARGMRFAADHGADVANLSIAGARDSDVLEDAVAYASSKGVTIVASAGNDGRAAISYPAAYPNVIAVGALARDGSPAYYSNRGKALDLVAPGGGGQSVGGGSGRQSGDGVLQQTLRGGPSSFCYCFANSTSAAAAQVSGVAALLIASGRATRPAQVASALRRGARDLGPRGPDPGFGAGLVQAASALSAARVPAERPPAPADPASAGLPWYSWLALTLAAAGAAGLLLLSRLRRGREYT